MKIINIFDHTIHLDDFDKVDIMYFKLFNFPYPGQRYNYSNEIYKIHKRLRGEK